MEEGKSVFTVTAQDDSVNCPAYYKTRGKMPVYLMNKSVHWIMSRTHMIERKKAPCYMQSYYKEIVLRKKSVTLENGYENVIFLLTKKKCKSG